MKIAVVGSHPQYEAMFRSEEGFEVVESFEEADALQFTGGEDVTPSLYGHKRHIRTYDNPERDAYEKGVFQTYMGKKPMLGICRGSQFLNVMNGGRLFQDVDGHAIGTTHPVFSQLLGKTYHCTSTHHQMMIPSSEGLVDGWAVGVSKKKEWVDESGTLHSEVRDKRDVEAVWYGRTRCLCFQPHPEFSNAAETREYYFALINQFIA